MSTPRPIRKLAIEFADGAVEIWETLPGDTTPFWYKESRNHQTAGRNNPALVATWKEHTIRWTSDRWEKPKNTPGSQPSLPPAAPGLSST